MVLMKVIETLISYLPSKCFTTKLQQQDSMNTKSILILSDTHFPYQIPQYFEWIKKIKEKVKPTMVIMIGDLVDFHSISSHLHSAELPNIKYEIKDAIKCIKKLRKIFPCEIQIMWGNHDIRIQRLAEKSAIPNSFLKDINDKVKLVGPTWFTQRFHPWLNGSLGIPAGENNHIQSWCFGLDKIALRLLIDHKKLDSSGKAKKLIIKDHEIGISRFLRENNFSIKPFQLSRSTNKENGDINHNGMYFGTTLNPLEVMFYKTKGSGRSGGLNNEAILNNYTTWKIQETEK